MQYLQSCGGGGGMRLQNGQIVFWTIGNLGTPTFVSTTS